MNELSKEQLWSVFVDFFKLDSRLTKMFNQTSVDISTDDICKLAHSSVKARAYELYRHVALVASLRVLDRITAHEAVELLQCFAHDPNALNNNITRHVFDVLWLVAEDQAGEFAEPDDDRLLDTALEKYLELFREFVAKNERTGKTGGSPSI